jgi:ABC-type Zn uptake system ZnuABC Zn-binding protein ZnuA
MKKLRILSLLVLGMLVAALLAACGATNTPSTNATTGASTGGKIKAVATTTIISDMVKNVSGDKLELVTILKPGSDPHDYEPTANDSKAIADAQIIFLNGAGLEESLEKAIEGNTKATKVTLTENVKLRKGEEAAATTPKAGEKKEEHEFDPHVWQSTDNAKIMVDNIVASLVKVDSAGKATYEANAKTYKGKIDETASEMKKLLEQVPADRRKLVTNHDAFGYLADQYKYEVVGTVFSTFDTTSEPSAKDVADLVAKIKTQKVPAVFTENTTNPKLAEQLSKDAGVKVVTNLYTDSLGANGTDGDTYLKMMLANAKSISTALK